MKTKKHFLCGFLMLALALPVFAQHDEPVLVNVRYQFVHVYDVNLRDKPYIKNMVLHIGQSNSQYTDWDAEESYKKMMAEQAAEAKEPNAKPRIVAQGMLTMVLSSITNNQCFQMPLEKKLVEIAHIGSVDYLFESPLPPIKWKIEKESRVIDTFTCQKAVGEFRGRKYTAWFTTQLPFKAGPWKLCGLPGVILEAKDDKDEVSFLFKEITRADSGQTITANSSRAIKVDEKGYWRAKEMFWDDPVSFVSAQWPNYKDNIPIYYRLPSGKLLHGDAAKDGIKNDKKVNNNPVELTKK